MNLAEKTDAEILRLCELKSSGKPVSEEDARKLLILEAWIALINSRNYKYF